MPSSSALTDKTNFSSPIFIEDDLYSFLEARERNRANQETSFTRHTERFIAQWTETEGRATCSIASRLNGLIGIGALSTARARLAHHALAVGDHFFWVEDGDPDIEVPILDSQTLQHAFNKPGILPVKVEFSTITPVSPIRRSELAALIGNAAAVNVAIILGRDDICHDVVAVPTLKQPGFVLVDSITPSHPLSLSTSEVCDYLYEDPLGADIQLLHEAT